MASVKANCNPEMLAWAREDSGFTLERASERTGFTLERLEGWETGQNQPTIPQLRKLALVYQRPLAVFFMPEPPEGFQRMRDFRRMPDADEIRWSPALRALVRRIRSQQRTFARLVAELGEQPAPLARAPRPDDPERLGSFVRETLHVGIDDQQRWRDDASALRGWMRAVEAQDILVVHTPTTRGQTIALDEMLGLSEAEPFPIIVLNGRDYARRRTFTLLHEYAHLLLRDAGVCDLHDRYTTPNFDPTEVFCNAVAAAVLMPRDVFLQDPDVRQGGAQTEWSNHTLGLIAVRFTTSREAVLRRLLTLDRTTVDYYSAWRERYYRDLRNREETEPSTGFATYYPMKLRELGLPYVRTVVEAYERDIINASDVARFLNLKFKNLPALEDEAAKALQRAV